MLGIPGTKRVTAQGMITPTNTAYRIYDVHYVSTGSTTTLALVNTTGAITVTGSGSEVRLIVPAAIGPGNWSSDAGLVFPDGVFVQTSASFAFAVINYETER